MDVLICVGLTKVFPNGIFVHIENKCIMSGLLDLCSLTTSSQSILETRLYDSTFDFRLKPFEEKCCFASLTFESCKVIVTLP